MNIDDLIKELDSDLEVTKSELKDGVIYIYCEHKQCETCCPYCNHMSNSVHSLYTRKIQDLPIQSHKVQLIINVKKYFCINEECEHKTFAEPFTFVKPNAVRTIRLDEHISKIALRNSSMDTTRDLNDEAIDISLWSVLRIIKKNDINC